MSFKLSAFASAADVFRGRRSAALNKAAGIAADLAACSAKHWLALKGRRFSVGGLSRRDRGLVWPDGPCVSRFNKSFGEKRDRAKSLEQPSTAATPPLMDGDDTEVVVLQACGAM